MNDSKELFAHALRTEFNTQPPMPSGLTLGENGCPEYTLDGLGDSRLAIFSKAVRNIPTSKLHELFASALSQISRIIDPEQAMLYLRDLFVLAFEKRDCRGGEGERDIFYYLFWKLAVDYSLYLDKEMISLIPEYGSWNDLFRIITFLRDYNKSFKAKAPAQDLNEAFVEESFDESDEDDEDDEDLLSIGSSEFGKRPRTKTLFVEDTTADDISNIIIDVVHDQWLKDCVLKTDPDAPISLLAKWLPTERGEFAKKNHKIFRRLLAKFGIRESEYRHKLTALRAKINLAETHMCNGTWAEIDPSKTPSVCAFKWRKPLLNLPLEQNPEEPSALRYPDREDRMEARQHWLDAVKTGKIKGGQLCPAAMVTALGKATSQEEINLINVQWVSFRETIRAKVEQAKRDGFDPMDAVIPMVDLSPSMKGQPKQAAIGLGIMCSELNSGACANLLITFDSECHVVDLASCTTFSEKVAKIKSLPMGYSTNFHLAMTRICKLVLKYKLPQDAVPALLILSDEQFDHPQFGYSSTMEDELKRMFEEVGMQVSGIPYLKPRTIHWNLRGDTDGYPAQADDRNVQMIANYSPALFDLILCGMPEPTPYQTMRRKLDSSRYQPIRDAFDAHKAVDPDEDDA